MAPAKPWLCSAILQKLSRQVGAAARMAQKAIGRAEPSNHFDGLFARIDCLLISLRDLVSELESDTSAPPPPAVTVASSSADSDHDAIGMSPSDEAQLGRLADDRLECIRPFLLTQLRQAASDSEIARQSSRRERVLRNVASHPRKGSDQVLISSLSDAELRKLQRGHRSKKLSAEPPGLSGNGHSPRESDDTFCRRFRAALEIVGDIHEPGGDGVRQGDATTPCDSAGGIGAAQAAFIAGMVAETLLEKFPPANAKQDCDNFDALHKHLTHVTAQLTGFAERENLAKLPDTIDALHETLKGIASSDQTGIVINAFSEHIAAIRGRLEGMAYSLQTAFEQQSQQMQLVVSDAVQQSLHMHFNLAKAPCASVVEQGSQSDELCILHVGTQTSVAEGDVSHSGANDTVDAGMFSGHAHCTDTASLSSIVSHAAELSLATAPSTPAASSLDSIAPASGMVSSSADRWCDTCDADDCQQVDCLLNVSKTVVKSMDTAHKEQGHCAVKRIDVIKSGLQETKDRTDSDQAPGAQATQGTTTGQLLGLGTPLGTPSPSGYRVVDSHGMAAGSICTAAPALHSALLSAGMSCTTPTATDNHDTRFQDPRCDRKPCPTSEVASSSGLSGVTCINSSNGAVSCLQAVVVCKAREWPLLQPCDEDQGRYSRTISQEDRKASAPVRDRSHGPSSPSGPSPASWTPSGSQEGHALSYNCPPAKPLVSKQAAASGGGGQGAGGPAGHTKNGTSQGMNCEQAQSSLLLDLPATWVKVRPFCIYDPLVALTAPPKYEQLVPYFTVQEACFRFQAAQRIAGMLVDHPHLVHNAMPIFHRRSILLLTAKPIPEIQGLLEDLANHIIAHGASHMDDRPLLQRCINIVGHAFPDYSSICGSIRFASLQPSTYRSKKGRR
eukprot:TRINITY_DN10517_c0_g1_i1.p1 TRINITY_DN10517_c0_g1~~TRINITY_DN10517_c0_g1_i1.p1  ORF type:complete len:899 (-),score=110.16 TRINITY_DN10517_c0_g1_i1:222-2918(-)